MYLDQIELKGKKVLVRVDFNVPLDDNYTVTDDTRIRGALPTIEYILEQGAAVILMSHLGRPQKKTKEDGSINKEKFTLKHTVSRLSELLGKSVGFVGDTVGNVVEEAVERLEMGGVLVLENTRFYKEEKKGDQDFAAQMAKLADVYINDAFGTAHRAHASTCTVAQFFDKDHRGFGFLIQKELESAKKLTDHPERPFTAIVGGAKVSDKILLLEKLVDSVDNIIIGGGMAYTLLKAQGGEVGSSLLEEDKLEVAKALLEKAALKGVQILLPEDSLVADDFNNEAARKVVNSKEIPTGWMGLDIGPKAIETFEGIVTTSKTLVWNGPMGVFEFSNFANGTSQIAEAVVKATEKGAFSLIGGGDSVAAINKAGKADQVSFVSTGGGAMLKLLEGDVLPGVAAIVD
ncbi:MULTISPECIES: phosphoglycerate kinase [unclassified Aureispira]|uniref:phosphoglycerate kinase n=1 Tax=unclassified Aureispira TaxID=2649989 RepID=UPI000696D9EC|nr:MULTISPECIES: phosphoglycerate kinase [unclassified Aureispira]WMX13855.1 phosphoglycerate kinase [Aureispira sp. CCB-E]